MSKKISTPIAISAILILSTVIGVFFYSDSQTELAVYPSKLNDFKNISKENTTSSQPVLINKIFQYPYPLTWSEISDRIYKLDYSLVGISVGKREIPSFASPSSSYRPGDKIYALTMYLKIRTSDYTVGFCPNVNLRMELNEEGDFIAPINTVFNDECFWGNQTHSNQEAIFVVPESQKKFNITTGGESNIFFTITVLGNGDINVEKSATSESEE